MNISKLCALEQLQHFYQTIFTSEIPFSPMKLFLTKNVCKAICAPLWTYNHRSFSSCSSSQNNFLFVGSPLVISEFFAPLSNHKLHWWSSVLNTNNQASQNSLYFKKSLLKPKDYMVPRIKPAPRFYKNSMDTKGKTPILSHDVPYPFRWEGRGKKSSLNFCGKRERKMNYFLQLQDHF